MRKCFYILFTLGFILSCTSNEPKKYVWQSKDVIASAYNSLAYQTSSQPNITAFGDSLKPGMKCIAVSRDLLALGIKHNTLVAIEGLEGIYLVKDKMNRRYKNHIDIYMGNNVKAAKIFGRKKLTISYRLEVKDSI
jgi:3D (Asp-Asp-Asp) domain-containing protein